MLLLAISTRTAKVSLEQNRVPWARFDKECRHCFRSSICTDGIYGANMGLQNHRKSSAVFAAVKRGVEHEELKLRQAGQPASGQV